MTSGPAVGAKYTVEYDGGSTKTPQLIGTISVDRKHLELRSNGLRDLKSVFENGPFNGLTIYQKGTLQGIGFRR